MKLPNTLRIAAIAVVAAVLGLAVGRSAAAYRADRGGLPTQPGMPGVGESQ